MVEPPENREAALRQAIRDAAHLLPAQGPIGVFVHHNTLHAFEHLPFERAIAEAAALLGAEPYPDEAELRDAFARGRILERDLDAVLSDELGAAAAEPLIAGRTRAELRKLVLLHASDEPSAAALDWRVEEGRLFSSEAERALWQACTVHFARTKTVTRGPALRPRDGLLGATGKDVDQFVHPTLIRLCAAFLDQGVAYWPMPGRERGLWVAARELLGQPAPPPNAWVKRIADEMRRQSATGSSAADVVLEILDELELEKEDWLPFIRATLLALPGWAGMLHQIEQRPDRAPAYAPPASLVDYLALRLSLEREAWRFVASLHGLPERPLSALRAIQPVASQRPDFSLVHDAFVVLSRAGVAASELDPASAERVTWELDAFGTLERRRIWHLAYERRHAEQVLGAIARHVSAPAPPPRFQAVFCIDERSESLRRHLEEVLPEVQTWATAGFFGVAMYFRGIDDAHAVPLCPIGITPRHEVHELALPGATERLARRRAQRRFAGRFAHGAYVGSQTFVRGTVWSAALGMLSAVPLVLRVLLPRASGRLGKSMRELSLPKLDTVLDLEREGDARSSAGHLLGFSVEEMTEIVAGVLEDMGLVAGFAPLVLIVGHGSSSLNNPHESAHDCGACGGGRGGPNARAFAQMANHPVVREKLAARGIEVPSDTWFVGAIADTCSDSVVYFDLGAVPPAQRERLSELRVAMDRARARDAHERCRRFESAGVELTPAEALRHVEARAEDLAQPRPEYGHATNAVAIIGRRARTRGLFLDRRAFLVSYDPTTDPEGRYLSRLLASVVPVGAGINLEYYFSYVDSVRFGCGTKLPHNITGLVGVMDGYSSDLRTGLPWQMVEIHEPVRLLTIVEARPENLLRAVEPLPAVRRLVENRWLRLCLLDPDSSELLLHRDGAFVPYRPEPGELATAQSSIAWYRGRREHLPPARIVGPRSAA